MDISSLFKKVRANSSYRLQAFYDLDNMCGSSRTWVLSPVTKDMTSSELGSSTATISSNLGEDDTYVIKLYYKTYSDYIQVYYAVTKKAGITPAIYNMANFLNRDIPIMLPQFSSSDGGSVSIGLFENMTHLGQVDLSGFNLSTMTDAGRMFRNCSKLEYVDYTTTVFRPTVTKEMFANCSSITELDFKSRFKFNAGTGNLKNCSGMFLNCTSLRTIWSYENREWKVTSDGLSANMFKGCTSLVGATSSYSGIGESVLSANNYDIRFATPVTDAAYPYALLKYR